MSVIHYISTPLTLLREMNHQKISHRKIKIKIKIKRKKSILPKILFKKKVSPEKKAKTPKVIPLSSLERVKGKYRFRNRYWG